MFSTISDLTAAVADHWDMATEPNLQLMHTGMRDVYLVSAGDERFVPYLYPSEKDVAHVESEWELALHLRSKSINVPVAFRLEGGRYSTRSPGGRLIVLCEFISGRSYREHPTAQLAEAFGREIARIHCESEDLDLNRPLHGPRTHMDSSVDALRRVFPNQHQLLDLLESAIPILDEHITCLPKEAPVYGLIYGDVIRANAIVRPDGTLWVIDFDLCGMGWRSYDIASFTYVSSGAQEGCANSFRMVR